MKKILITLGLLVAGVVATNMYFAHQIRLQLEDVTKMIRSFGGVFSYTGVNVNLRGHLELTDVSFFGPGMDDSVRVEKVSIRSGSLFGVQKLARDFHQQRAPGELNIAFEGMHVPLNGDAFKQLMTPSGSDEHFLMAGCGEHKQLTQAELNAMGYGPTVLVDSYVNFHLFNNGQWMELEATTKAKDMNEISFKLDVTLNSPSRDFMALGAAAPQATLNNVKLTYLDHGLTQRILNYCQQETELPKEDYIQAHLASFKTVLHGYGVNVGENALRNYQSFILQSGSLGLLIKPITEFRLQEFANADPEYIEKQFRMTMLVNDQEAGELDVIEMTQQEKDQFQSSQSKQSVAIGGVATEMSLESSREIAVAKLDKHIAELVEVETISGRLIEGRILQADGKKLLLHVFQENGTMEIPIKYAQIMRVNLK